MVKIFSRLPQKDNRKILYSHTLKTRSYLFCNSQVLKIRIFFCWFLIFNLFKKTRRKIIRRKIKKTRYCLSKSFLLMAAFQIYMQQVFLGTLNLLQSLLNFFFIFVFKYVTFIYFKDRYWLSKCDFIF